MKSATTRLALAAACSLLPAGGSGAPPPAALLAATTPPPPAALLPPAALPRALAPPPAGLDEPRWEWVRGGHVASIAARGPGLATTAEDGGRIREIRLAADGAVATGQDSGVGTELLDVQFLDEREGFAVGGMGGGCVEMAPAQHLGGFILHTTDGGRTWTRLPDPNVSDERMQLEAVAFRDPLHGAVVGWQFGKAGPPSCPSLQACKTSAIFVTADGGRTWAARRRFVAPSRYTSIAWWNTKIGWATRTAPTTNLCTKGDARIYGTVDGGTTWTAQPVAGKGHLWDVAAVPRAPGAATSPLASSRGIAVGRNGRIARTTDGVTWSPVPSPTTDSLFGVAFGTSRRGWAVGDAGTILRTDDAGASWSPIGSPVTVRLEEVAAWGADEAWVAGSFGTVLHTADGGATWQVLFGPEPDHTDLVALSGGRAIAVGRGGAVSRLSAFGARETRLATLAGDLLAVDFAGGEAGWAGGKNGTNQNPVLYATRDGGTTWTSQAAGPKAIRGIDFLDSQTGWTVANEGVPTLRSFPRLTANGGIGWGDLPDLPGGAANVVRFLDDREGFLLGGVAPIVCQISPPSGRDATVWRTVDGGWSWTRVYTELSLNCSMFLDMAAIDAQRMIAVGAITLLPPVGGVIVRSTDRGVTWARVHFEIGWDARAAASAGPQATWVAGGAGQVRRSTDGGATWTAEDAPTTEVIGALSLSPEQDVLWALGDEGVVLRRFLAGEDASARPAR